MTRVVAPSRLHFGLLNAGHAPGAPRFGGCGLMVAAPGVAVRVEPAAEWAGAGPNADRAVAFARRVTNRCHRVTVERCPPEHVGLGVGTALGLAVAKALRPDAPTAELAALTGRGGRSGVGLHGFDRGGFILDAGKPAADALPELARHLPFPAAWRVVLVRPPQPSPWFGERERAAFAHTPESCPVGHAGTMRTALGELERAVAAGDDFDRFAGAVRCYNREAGRWFAAAQGGLYAGPAVAELVERLYTLGFVGAGQTSWGPTVFAFAPDPDRAEWLAARLRHESPELVVDVAAAADRGAVVQNA